MQDDLGGDPCFEPKDPSIYLHILQETSSPLVDAFGILSTYLGYTHREWFGPDSARKAGLIPRF